MHSIDQQVRRLLTRRRVISSGLLGAISVGALGGCGGGSSASSSASTSGSTGSTGTTGSSGSCTIIPNETQGPYPLYSSVVSNSALWRQDVTEGRPGVPLTLTLTLVDVNNACAPLANYDVYIWHCDKDGVYSGYPNQTGGVDATGETFMRGVQTTDANGRVTFMTVYPGWYAGRITHVHFRVFLGATLEATSQLCFPQDVTQAVYASTLYAAHGQNTSVTSFAQDGVFSDGTTYQMASIAGSVSAGYVATLTAGIAL
ncbi:MAG: hypothetical protein RL684_3076 [Pseudomonadota bacterium]|jgi:protocatechuate 3,4-dioxygenase beta subunit